MLEVYARRLVVTAALLMWAVPAWAQTYPEEYRTVISPTLERWGNGINYDTGGGVLGPSDPTIKSDAGTWYMDTGPLTWVLDKSTKSLDITRKGQTVGIKPVAIVYFDRSTLGTTNDYTVVSTLGSPTPTLESEKLTLSDVFLNVDIELYSEPEGPQMDYIINSKAGYPATPYNAEDTWVVFVHELDISDAPSILPDGAAINWSGTDAKRINFDGAGKWSIVPSFARSSDDINLETRAHETRIRNYLFIKGGKYYFVEGVRYDWFQSAAFPVRMHYDTVSGTISSNTTWTSGTTYFISGDVTVGAGIRLTVQGGAFVKFSTASRLIVAGELVVDGALNDLAEFTSCEDNSLGEDTSAASGCSGTEDTPAAGDWEGIFTAAADTAPTIVGMHCQYAGDSVSSYLGCPDHATHGFAQVGLTMSESIIENFINDSDTSYMLAIDVDSGISDVTINVHDNYFRGESGVSSGTNTMVYFYTFRNASGGTVGYFHNNFIRADDQDISFALTNYDSASDEDEITNNTVICTESDTGGPPVNQDGGQVYDNIIYGCERFTLANGSADYNGVYNLVESYTPAANDVTSDPLMTSHAHTDGVPSWATGYHITTSTSPAIDAGSTTAATRNLDDKHATSDGAADSGTVDMGFHFPGAAAAARRIILTQNKRR